MIEAAKQHIDNSHNRKLKKYYRLHARLYDATRWSFLFGRKKLLNNLPELPPEPRILEVGCGTGKNIRLLKHLYPEAEIVGVDLSDDMLKLARQKVSEYDQVSLICQDYGSEHIGRIDFDLILLSYSLTMMEKPLKNIFQKMNGDLAADGCLAIVDFHTSPFNLFKKWMKKNHVNMNGDLYPLLRQHYRPIYENVKKAYFGLWSYFLFVGKEK